MDGYISSQKVTHLELGHVRRSANHLCVGEPGEIFSIGTGILIHPISMSRPQSMDKGGKFITVTL